MTVRIIETIQGEEKQHRFSDWKVNNRVIVGLHDGASSPTAEEMYVKTPDQQAVLMFSSWSWMLSRIQMSHPSEYAGNKTGYSCLRTAFCNYVDFLCNT